MDKAGAYGIQGLGGALVSHYSGSFANIVGLPLGSVLSALVELGALPRLHHEVDRRLRVIKGRIAAACQAAGRASSDVTVVGASKGQSLDIMRAAVASGLKDFGENYVQEWLKKQHALPDDLQWHFIGHLQRNKAKLVVPHVTMIHGVDSPKTLGAIARLGRDQRRMISVCLQVNLGGESSKSGVPAHELGALVETARSLDGIELSGLMAIPPKGSLGETRRWFAQLRTLRDQWADDDCPMRILSMGMSSDFDGAVAEGATHVRIGSTLFGPRL